MTVSQSKSSNNNSKIQWKMVKLKFLAFAASSVRSESSSSCAQPSSWYKNLSRYFNTFIFLLNHEYYKTKHNKNLDYEILNARCYQKRIWQMLALELSGFSMIWFFKLRKQIRNLIFVCPTLSGLETRACNSDKNANKQNIG